MSVIILIITGSVIYALFAMKAARRNKEKATFKLSTGKVIKFKIGLDSNFRPCSYPVIGFRTQKGEYYRLPYRGGMTFELMNLTDGDAVNVFYNPDQPADFYIQ